MKQYFFLGIIRNYLISILFKIYYILKRHYKKNKNHIFILNTPLLSFMFRIAALGIKTEIVYIVHGYRFNKNSNFFIYFIFFIIEYFLSFKVNKYITINKYDYQITKKFFSNNTIKIKGMGINLESYKNTSNKNLNNFSIGVLSAYRKNKGYYDLIKIAQKLSTFNNFKIYCYGYDIMKNTIKYQET